MGIGREELSFRPGPAAAHRLPPRARPAAESLPFQIARVRHDAPVLGHGARSSPRGSSRCHRFASPWRLPATCRATRSPSSAIRRSIAATTSSLQNQIFGGRVQRQAAPARKAAPARRHPELRAPVSRRDARQFDPRRELGLGGDRHRDRRGGRSSLRRALPRGELRRADPRARARSARGRGGRQLRGRRRARPSVGPYWTSRPAAPAGRNVASSAADAGDR